MSSGLDWELFGVITGGDEVCILPPPTLSENGVGIPTSVHFPLKIVVLWPWILLLISWDIIGLESQDLAYLFNKQQYSGAHFRGDHSYHG